jgi:hypothetical protein
MEQVIIRIFDTFSCAEQAREALLAAGFEHSGVELSIRADEAGGTKGNFTVGNYRGAADGPIYERDFAHESAGGDCVLTVTARDAADAGRAAAIMQRYGAIDRSASG